MGAARAASRALAYFRIAIIARILAPAQFGVFGIASIVLAFIEILTETGVNVFLIQQKEDFEKYINTAWVISILRGIIVALVILASAPLIALFYNSQESLSLVMLISIVPFIRGFINPAEVKFQKQLAFHKEFYFRTAIMVVEIVISIILVVHTKSPVGLVWGLAGAALFEVLFSLLFIKPAPKIEIRLDFIKKIFHSGKWVTAYSVFDFLFYNGDTVIVGKILGLGALGIYDMAYTIAITPITEITDVVGRVTFPVFAKISGEKDRLKRAFLKTLLFVLLPGIPATLIFILFPRELIMIVLGPKWLPAVPVLQVLGIFGVIKSISSATAPLFLSLHKQNYIAIISLAGFVILFITIVPFINMFGITGAGIAAILSSILVLPLTFYLLHKALLQRP